LEESGPGIILSLVFIDQFFKGIKQYFFTNNQILNFQSLNFSFQSSTLNP